MKTDSDTTQCAEGSLHSDCYAAIRAELGAAGHTPAYRSTVAGPAFGLRYNSTTGKPMILWALVPLSDEQRATFAAALLAERGRLHNVKTVATCATGDTNEGNDA